MRFRVLKLALLSLVLVSYVPGLPGTRIRLPAISATNTVSFTLYGSFQYPNGAIGWGFTPTSINNPDLVVSAGQMVNLTMYSADGLTHGFCVDYETVPDYICNPPEPESLQFASKTIPTKFSFTAPTTPGNYTYFCTVHGADMSGNFIVQAANDVAVTGIALSRNFAYQGVFGPPIKLNVTAANQGASTQTFYVSATANSTLVGNQSITLGSGKTGVVSFNWTTSILAKGNYVLVAQASQVPGETNTVNNVFNGGLMFAVRYRADVNNDCLVDVSDLAIVGAAFGKTKGQPNYNMAADINNDGIVDVSDLAIVGGAFGQRC